MSDKAVDTCPSTIEYAPDQFKTQEMYDKAVDKCHFLFDSLPINTRLKKYVIKSFLMILF